MNPPMNPPIAAPTTGTGIMSWPKAAPAIADPVAVIS